MAKYSYTLTLLGLVFPIEAQSLEKARVKLLNQWLSVIDADHRHYPVVPIITLIATTDPTVPQSELTDPRTELNRPVGLKLPEDD